MGDILRAMHQAHLERKARLYGTKRKKIKKVVPVTCEQKEPIADLEVKVTEVEQELLAGLEAKTKEIADKIAMQIESYAEPEPIRTPITMARIKYVVAERYGYTVVELESPRRNQPLTLARAIAYHLARRLTHYSMGQIGMHFGGRDHTTIIYGDRKVVARRKNDPEFDSDIMALERKLSGEPSA